MKANRFIADFGLDEARKWIRDNPATKEFQFVVNGISGVCDDISHLKRLSDSHAIVDIIGNDLAGAIKVYEFSKDMKMISIGGLDLPIDRLKQAIEDVKSCNGDNEVA